LAENIFEQFGFDDDEAEPITRDVPSEGPKNFFSVYDREPDAVEVVTPEPPAPVTQDQPFEPVAGVKVNWLADEHYERIARENAERKRREKETLDKQRGDGFLEGITDLQQYGEFAKGVVPGAIRFAGTSAKGVAGIQQASSLASQTDAQRQLAIVDSLDRGEQPADATGFEIEISAYGQMTPEQKQAYRQKLQGQSTSPRTPLEDRTFYQTGESLTEYAQGLFPAAQGYDEAVGRQLGEGIGSMLAGLPAGFLGRVPALVFFGSGGSGEALERAVQHDKTEKKAGRPGLTEEQLATATLWGIGPGATDLLPVETLLGRLKIPQPFRGPIARAIGRIGGQAFVEGMQEAGQAFLQNLISQQVYNDSQTLGEGVVPEGGLGAGVGALAETGRMLIARFAGRKKPGGAPATDDDLTLEEIAEAIDNPMDQGQQVARETKQDKLDVTEQAGETLPKLAEEGRRLVSATHPDWQAFAKVHGNDAAIALAAAQMDGETVTLDEILQRAKLASDERSAERAAQGIADPRGQTEQIAQPQATEAHPYDAVPASAINGDLVHNLGRFFGEAYQGKPVLLTNNGFRPDEVAALERVGMASDGHMSLEQFQLYDQEYGYRVNRRIGKAVERDFGPKPQAKRFQRRGERPAETPSENVIRFIRERGGIQPSGETDAMDAGRYPGLVSQRGMTPDQAREALVEAGFLTESGADETAVTTPNDVYDLLDRAIRGERVVPVAEQAADRERIATEEAYEFDRELEAAEQNFVFPALAEIDAEIGAPVLADAYRKLSNDDKAELIERFSREGEGIDAILEEMAIRNEDAPTIAAMAIRRGATPEQIEQLRGVIQQASPELATVFDELVASLPKPRQAKARKPAAPVSEAGRNVISRLEGIGKQAELRSAVEQLGPTLKADEWKSVAYEVTGRNFPSGKQARQAVLDRLSDRLLMDERVEGIKRLFGREEQQERPRLSFPKSMSARPSRYRTGGQAETAQAPQRKEVGSTLTDFARASSASEIAERFNILQEDAASLLARNAFTGEAKTIVERLAGKAAEANTHAQNNDWEALGQVVGDMVADAATLTELDARPTARVLTQWVDTASRLAREGNIPIPERAEADPQQVRRQFASILNSKTPRSKWASTLGISEEQLAPLIDEAVRKGFLRRDRNGNVRRVPQSQRSGSFAAMVIPENLPDTIPGVGDVVLTPKAEAAKTELQAAIDRAAAKILPEAVSIDVRDNIAIATLRREDQMLALQSGGLAGYMYREAVSRAEDLRLRAFQAKTAKEREGLVRAAREELEKADRIRRNYLQTDNMLALRTGRGQTESDPSGEDAEATSAAKILPEAVSIDVRDNIAIATLRREDQMLALSARAQQSWQQQLQAFLDGVFSNEWINGEGFKAYVRKSERLDPNTGEVLPTLDIASIEVSREQRGQGTFRDVLASAIETAQRNGIQAVYVENVLTDQFASFFRNAGWTEDSRYGPPSFHLRIDTGRGQTESDPSAIVGEDTEATSAAEISNELDRIDTELRSLSAGLGRIMRIPSAKREERRKELVKERGRLIELYRDLPLEARAALAGRKSETAESPRVNDKGFILRLPFKERWGDPRFNDADQVRAIGRLREIQQMDVKNASWADLVQARNDINEITAQLFYYEPDVDLSPYTYEGDLYGYLQDLRGFSLPEGFRPSIFSATDLSPEIRDIVAEGKAAIDNIAASKRRGIENFLVFGDTPRLRKTAEIDPAMIGETQRSGFFFLAARKLADVPDALFQQGGQSVIDHLRQAGVKRAEIEHFQLGELAGEKTVTREAFQKKIAERMFDFRQKTSWLNPERSRKDYEFGGTRAFRGPRIPGRGVYFERLMAFPKKLKGGEPFAPGHFQSPHWQDALAGTWASWRGSTRDVPGYGKMVVGEEGQTDYMQGALGRGDDWTGKRPRISEKEYLALKKERALYKKVGDEISGLISNINYTSRMPYETGLSLDRDLTPGEDFTEAAKESWPERIAQLREFAGDDAESLKAVSRIEKLHAENEKFFEPDAFQKYAETEKSFTPESPLDESYVRTMVRDLLLLASKQKADSIAISTSETTNRIQVNTKTSAAHFYDAQLKPALEKELRKLTGDSSIKLEQVKLPKAIGAPRNEKAYTVWATKLDPDALAKVRDEGQPMFARTDGKAREHVIRRLAAGRPVSVEQEVVSAAMAAIQPITIPEGVRIGAIASLYPMPDGDFDATFTSPDGSSFHFVIDRDDVWSGRAIFHPPTGTILSMRFGSFPGPTPGDEFVRTVRGEVYHEVVHAVWRGLSGAARNRLAGHAESLKILDKSFKEYLKSIGEPSANSAPVESIRYIYEEAYQGRQNIDDLLAQESVAHMVELYSHGVLSDADIAPVRGLLEGVIPGVRPFDDQPLFARRGETPDPHNMIISITMNAVEAEAKAKDVSTEQEAVRVLRREAIKFFKDMGIFTEKEWNTLKSAAKRNGWVETAEVRKALAEAGAPDADAIATTAIAEQYSEFHLNQKQFTGTIAAVFQRIKDFIARISSFMRGEGFQTADDVFTKIDEGEFKARFNEAFPEFAPEVATDQLSDVAAQALPGNMPNPPLAPPPSGATPGLAPSPAGSLIDIQRNLRKRLGLTVKRGRLSPEMKRLAAQMGGMLRGQFSRQTGVIRLAVLEDIDSEAHEVGHALEDRYDLAPLKARHQRDLIGIAQMSGRDTVSEGFAEFFRLYLTNPQAAEAHAPGFFSEFEEFMDAQDPQTLADIQEIRDQYQDWRNASSAGRITAAVKSGVPESTFQAIRNEYNEGGVAAVSGMYWRYLERVYKGRFDRTNAIRKLMMRIARQAERNNQDLDLSAWRNPQMQAQKIVSSDAAAYIDLTQGVHWENSSDKGTVSLRDALLTAYGGVEFNNWSEQQRNHFGGYMIARRGRWLWQRHDMSPAQNRGRGPNPPGNPGEGDWYFDTMRRQRRIFLAGRWETELMRPPDKHNRADHEQAVADLEAANPQFAQASQMVYQFLRDLALKRYQAGLDSLEEYQYKTGTPDYVPWFRDMSDEIFKGTAVSGRKVAAKFAIKGSYRDFIDPIEGIARQVYDTNQEIAVNKPKLLLGKMADEVENAGQYVEIIPATRMRVEEVRIRDALQAAAIEEGLPPEDAKEMISTVASMLGEDAVAKLFKSEQAGEGRDAILHYMDNGVLKMLQIHDDGHGIAKDILGFFEMTRGTPFGDSFFDLITAVVRTPQRAITSTPGFQWRNLIRDMFNALVLQSGYFPLVSNARTVIDNRRRLARGEETWAQILARHGGIMGGINRSSIQQLRQGRVSNLRTEGVVLNPARRDFLTKTVNPLHEDFWKWAEWTEANTRQSIARISFNRALKDAQSRYPTMPQEQQTFIALESAVQRSRDYTDYGRSGDFASQVVFNRLVMFLNPALQGPDKMFRKLFLAQTDEGVFAAAQVVRKKLAPLFDDRQRSQAEKTLTKSEKDALKDSMRAWTTVAMIAVAHLMLELMLNDEDELRDKSELERALNIPMTINGQPYRIPRGFDIVNVMSNAVRAQYDSWRYEDPTAWQRFRRTLGYSLVPPHSSPLLDMYIGWKHNRNNFFDSAIEPEYMQGRLPEDRYKAYTSGLSKDMAEGINSVAPFEVSPLMVEYTMNTLGSDWARDIMSAYDVLDPDKPALRWQEYPFIRTTRGLRGTRGAEDFWDLMGRDGGDFIQPAGSYKQEAVKNKVWTQEDIRKFFERRVTDDDARAYAILNGHYDVDQRRLHPMERAKEFIAALSATSRQVAFNRVDDPRTGKRLEVTRAVRQQANEIMSEISRREYLNGLIAIQRPGYEFREPMPVKPYLEELKTVSPRIHAMLIDKIKIKRGTKVYDYDTVRELWPEIRRRLLDANRRETIIEKRAQVEFNDLNYAVGRARALGIR
jgi:hypothetical protein